jgi:hypothetical protein
MAITINGSGTIAGISVGGLENGCINEADLATAAVTNTKLASNAVTIDKLGTTEQSQLCKAWVNFNGTLVTNPGSATGIRASYNVSSITDSGAGLYTVNFTSSLSDANFAVGALGSQDNFNASTNSNIGLGGSSAGSVGLVCRNNADTAYVDYSYVTCAVFR